MKWVTLSIVLIHLVGGTEGLNSTEVPYGVAIRALGNARSYAQQYDVIIIRSHPRVIGSELMNSLYAQTNAFIKFLASSRGDVNLLNVYRQRLSNLRWAGATRRKRWSLLDPVGQLFGSIFGLTTNKASSQIKKKINDVIEKMTEHDQVIDGLTIAIKDLSHNQKDYEKTIQSLLERAQQVQSVIDVMYANITNIERKLIHTQSSVMIEAMLSLFEYYKTQEDRYDNMHRLTRDLAEIGHVTEDLIGQTRLRAILKEINSPLTVSYIYKYFPVHLVNLTPTEVAYVFTIPKVDPELYSAWHVAVVPHYHDHDYVQLIPELTWLGIGHTSGSLIDVSNCLYDHPKLCSNVIIYGTLPCAQGLMAKNPTQIQSCPLVGRNITVPIVSKVSDSQLLITGPPDTLVERCLGKPPVTVMTKPGALLIQGVPNCTVSSTIFQWSFTVGPTVEKSVRIADEFLLKGISVNLSLPSSTKPPPIDWTVINGLNNLTDVHIPSLLSRMPALKLFEVSAHKFGWWIGVALVGLLILGLILYVIYQRAIRPPNTASSTTPTVPKKPTPKEDQTDVAPASPKPSTKTPPPSGGFVP